MTSAPLAQLREVLVDKETQAALAEARREPEMEGARRLLALVAITENVLEIASQSEGGQASRPPREEVEG